MVLLQTVVSEMDILVEVLVGESSFIFRTNDSVEIAAGPQIALFVEIELPICCYQPPHSDIEFTFVI